MTECFCGQMAVFLVGEDGVPMCLAHYCTELEEMGATVDIAHAALDMAERRIRWMPVQRVDTGELL